jgi:hypothetical protein
LVKKYEVGISKLLIKSGFSMGNYFELSIIELFATLPRLFSHKIKDIPGNLNPYKYLRNLLVFTDPTFYYYQEMLKKEVPLIKVSLLKGSKRQMPPTNLLRADRINLQTVGLMRSHQIRTGSASNIDLWIPPRS